MRWTGRSPPPIRPSTRPSPPIPFRRPTRTRRRARDDGGIGGGVGGAGRHLRRRDDGGRTRSGVRVRASRTRRETWDPNRPRSETLARAPARVPRRTRPRSRASRIDGRVAEPRARVDHRRRERRGNGGEAFARIARGVFGRDRGAGMARRRRRRSEDEGRRRRRASSGKRRGFGFARAGRRRFRRPRRRHRRHRNLRRALVGTRGDGRGGGDGRHGGGGSDGRAFASRARRAPPCVAAGGRWNFTVGLVGKPSAGKSSFFNAATEAAEGAARAARVAPHPFTTIEPNLGAAFAPATCPCALVGLDRACDPSHGAEDVDGTHCRRIPILVKDVAGLVPGAHAGRGRGNAFLNDLCDADVLVLRRGHLRSIRSRGRRSLGR